MSIETRQHTLARPVKCTGIGVHSGRQVHLEILPAPINHGIKFLRTDLPGKPVVSAHFNSVVDTSLATVIGAEGVIVSTIEHLMATFAGLSIDNALVTLDGYEIPIMDGSAAPFTRLLQSAGVQRQEGLRCYFIIRRPIALRQADKAVTVLPADHYRITYAIDFEHPLLDYQELTASLWSRDSFVEKVAPARTFTFEHEVEALRGAGLARGGSLDNAVVVAENRILNPDLRFPDEFVRHKMLDLTGDLSLIGYPLRGHVVAYRAGHDMHSRLARRIVDSTDRWYLTTWADGPEAKGTTASEASG